MTPLLFPAGRSRLVKVMRRLAFPCESEGGERGGSVHAYPLRHNTQRRGSHDGTRIACYGNDACERVECGVGYTGRVPSQGVRFVCLRLLPSLPVYKTRPYQGAHCFHAARTVTRQRSYNAGAPARRGNALDRWRLSGPRKTPHRTTLSNVRGTASFSAIIGSGTLPDDEPSL